VTHRVLAAAASVKHELKSIEDVDPAFMTTDEKARAITEWAQNRARMDEVVLRMMASAADVAEQTGARDIAAWMAHATGSSLPKVREAMALADALDRLHPQLQVSLREGRTSTDQARVIAKALQAIPSHIEDAVVIRAEQTLIDAAATFGPKQLAKMGRHILEVVSPEIAEAELERSLARMDQTADEATTFTMRPNGDGTTNLRGVVPDHVANRLATYLHSYTNPRQAQLDEHGCVVDNDAIRKLPYGRRLGRAFCDFLENVDPQRMPIHGGDATTLVLTMDFENLKAGIGAGELLGSLDGTVDEVSIETVRRLACNANIVPAVLGSDSELLDLGRAQRLANKAQRKALALRDKTCKAEGCDIPAAWTEAHHWQWWLLGGPTDLRNMILFCAHHHHLVHDSRYLVERMSNGDVRFRLKR
jgi:hypothetical protein